MIEEAIPARSLPSPTQTTRKEIQEHVLTHLPPRSWCGHCLRRRGTSLPHFRSKTEGEQIVPTVSIDYFFMGPSGQEEAQGVLQMLAVKSHESRMTFAHVVEPTTHQHTPTTTTHNGTATHNNNNNAQQQNNPRQQRHNNKHDPTLGGSVLTSDEPPLPLWGVGRLVLLRRSPCLRHDEVVHPPAGLRNHVLAHVLCLSLFVQLRACSVSNFAASSMVEFAGQRP